MIGLKAAGEKPKHEKESNEEEKKWTYSIGNPYSSFPTRHLSAKDNTVPLPKPLSRLEQAWFDRYGFIPEIEEDE